MWTRKGVMWIGLGELLKRMVEKCRGWEFVCRAPDDGLEVQESRRKLFEDGGGRECLSQWSPTQPNEIYQ